MDGDYHAKRLRTIQRIDRLVDTMTDSFDRRIIDAHGHEVCRLPAGGYGTTEFDRSEHRMTALIEAGRVAMSKFFCESERARPHASADQVERAGSIAKSASTFPSHPTNAGSRRGRRISGDVGYGGVRVMKGV